jgi:hypothetical protein
MSFLMLFDTVKISRMKEKIENFEENMERKKL